MTDYLLAALGIILCIIGILGCIVPFLPGTPFNWLALLLLHFTRFADFSWQFLLSMAVVTVAVIVLDYIVPIWGAKKYGGSKQGTWGATIGMLAGIFFLPPIGLILGPFAGAYIGETIAGKNNKEAFRASWGTLLGFFLGTGLKLASSLIMTFFFVKNLIA